MASYHHLLQHKNPRHDSPAKVFAKLKSKVQREAVCAKKPPCNGREKHGADSDSSRRSTEESFRTTDGLADNQRFGFDRSEVQTLTLSPISTPQRTNGYLFSNGGETEHAFMSRNGHTPTKRAFMESTAVSHPFSLLHREPPHIRHPAGFPMCSRTPVKIQTIDYDCVGGVFEEESDAPPVSPSTMFSPVEKRLRKRKLEQHHEFNRVSSSRKEVHAGVKSHPQERRTSTALTLSEDSSHDQTCLEDVGDVGGCPADPSEVDQGTREPLFPPPRSTAEKRGFVIMEKFPLMSPAKTFAYMKQRESKRGHREVREVNSSTRDLFGEGIPFHQARALPLPSTQNTADVVDTASRSVPESVVPVNRSGEESADSRLYTSEDTLIPAAPPHRPVLLEDSLVLNSPQISIPKKRQAVFRRNNWPQSTKFPDESAIYLKNWFLRKNHNGLFVDGINRENNIPWNSNIIVDRVSNSVLKTVSGRLYILVGKMNLSVAFGFPSWLLKKFVNGFPANWKSLYEKFLSDSREETESTTKGKTIIAKTKYKASSIVSAKPQRQKSFKTPDSCPPASSAKVSRSGRVIKPPLEYWKGGRVILDAHMNVTIHECYDTSICIPEVTSTVSARKSQKPARVFLPCSEGHKQSESACDEEAPVPLRKVKAPLRKRNPAKVIHDEKPSNQPEPSVVAISSPEEWSGTTTRSRKRCPAMGRLLTVDNVPQKQKEPEKAPSQRSKKQTHDTIRSSARACKQTVTASPESPTVNDETLQSSDEDIFTKRKKQGKRVTRKSGTKAHDRSQPSQRSWSSQSSESSEESGKERRRRTTVTKHSNAAQTLTNPKRKKCTKISPPTKLLPKSTVSSRTQKANKGSAVTLQEQDEDKWTEEELMRLEEAVSFFPKHMSGYWAKVAKMVGTRSAEECHSQHTSQGTSQTPAKRAKKPRKEKVEAPKDPVTDHPLISARFGTLKRKQQVRQFLETMPRENVDDVFSSAYMQNKRFEIPSMCQSEDQDFSMSDVEHLTPMSKVYPEVKTPQCLHITPGMMGSPDRENDDKYVFQLQKRMKKNQFNVCKQARSSKGFTPSSVKQTMRRCGNTENDTFVVWEMFPGKNVALSESEEEDFYFSDSN
ncbi:mis18-binding protein 1 isoform X2 [Scophthalmus maximus]|uniref:mis18-binding protein 1 isoform X2 n=1 Tax=Scophthalmus maximus TaxID=52904 RepID=UPI001FA94129|nr:mis18-binding protein 1 isoform X2 [Scophthalmus maximus]